MVFFSVMLKMTPLQSIYSGQPPNLINYSPGNSKFPDFQIKKANI